MKKNMSYFLLICISIFLIKNCTTSSSPDTKDKIIGRWIWLQSSGGWTGGTITPESVGYGMTVVFERNGIYNEFKNDSHPSRIYNLTSYYNHIVSFDSNLLVDTITKTYQSQMSDTIPSYDLTVLENLPYDFQHYIYQTITGKLYDFFLEEKIKGWVGNQTREKIKTNVFTLFYQEEEDNQSSIMKEMFKQAFPNVFKYIEISKNRDYKKFSISLQKTESDMILRTICKRILSEKPSIPIFTIHDSILSTSEHTAISII
jgi:hypothetical protein